MKTVHDHPGAKLKHLARPYNVYNIFFILERARLIQQAAVQAANSLTPAIQSPPSSVDFSGYEQLYLPELPPRYYDLQLPPNWYVPGKNAKRKHVATNGLRNFTALAQTVAQNWRAVDQVTFSYCQSVAKIIKERHADLLTKAGGGLQQQQKKHPEKGTTATETQCLPGAAMKSILLGQETENRSSSSKSTSVVNIRKYPPALVTPEVSRVPKLSLGGVTPSCHHRSLVHHVKYSTNTLATVKSSLKLPEERALTSSIHGKEEMNPALLRTSHVITPTSKIFDIGADQWVVDRNMTSSPILSSLMSSLNPMPGEKATSLDIHDMFWQLEERIPSADQLSALKDPIPLERLVPVSFDSDSFCFCNIEDDFRNISDSEVNELRRLLIDG